MTYTSTILLASWEALCQVRDDLKRHRPPGADRLKAHAALPLIRAAMASIRLAEDLLR